MIGITTAFVVCWLPIQLYTLLAYGGIVIISPFMYYPFAGIACFNICANSIIYASQYSVIKKTWRAVFGACAFGKWRHERRAMVATGV